MHTFVYIPALEGYDATTWSTISGTPQAYDNALHVTEASCMTYTSMVRGQANFYVNVPVDPTLNTEARYIGFQSLATGEKAYFEWNVSDGAVYGRVNNATAEGVGTSDAIVWNDAWTGANTTFSIRWEASYVRFFINDINVATIATDPTVPHQSPVQPMSILLQNDNADDMAVYSISVTGIQSIYTPFDAEDGTHTTTPTNKFCTRSDAVGITESVTNSVEMSLSVSESLGVGEALG